MITGALGRIYEDGDCIFSAGDPADAIYVVQHGEVELIADFHGRPILLYTLTTGDIFGQMALFRHTPRETTARARGQARVLTVAKEAFLRRIHEDPSLAYQALRGLAYRVDTLTRQVLSLRQNQPPPLP